MYKLESLRHQISKMEVAIPWIDLRNSWSAGEELNHYTNAVTFVIHKHSTMVDIFVIAEYLQGHLASASWFTGWILWWHNRRVNVRLFLSWFYMLNMLTYTNIYNSQKHF